MALLRVRTFARYAELLGDPIELDVQLPISLPSLHAALKRLPRGDLLPAKLLIAIDQRLAQPDRMIIGTEEVAILPPLAGG
ncbi:MAG: MoaD/ThiS family protein [Gemmatimonadota bacterium]